MSAAFTWNGYPEVVLRFTYADKNRFWRKISFAVFCRDILRGLAYLHSQGKVHGDIKCSNILVGDQNLKLCDLGKGKVLEDGEVYLQPKKGQCAFRKRIYTTGSDGYKAPEVEDEIAQGPKADIYALGCTLVETASGFPPQKVPRIYMSDDPMDLDSNTGVFKSTLHIQTSFSAECHDFLDACLADHPDCRPSAELALQHRWFIKFPLEYPIKSGQSEGTYINFSITELKVDCKNLDSIVNFQNIFANLQLYMV
ncbi:hypothetical protein R1flu_010421 [Riccia fluitans]|uniref:Protein kinase domain-containing protein n=1 Tax=Riccia fluitans TaxID=41844 RepID=A0ABD1Z614_9MARC